MPPASWTVHAGCLQTLVRSWVGWDLPQHHVAPKPARLYQPISFCPVAAVSIHAPCCVPCRVHMWCWGLARCGRHDFADRRAAQQHHMCPFPSWHCCVSNTDSLEHAFFRCPARARASRARQRWHHQADATINLLLRTLFRINSEVGIVANLGTKAFLLLMFAMRRQRVKRSDV